MDFDNIRRFINKKRCTGIEEEVWLTKNVL